MSIHVPTHMSIHMSVRMAIHVPTHRSIDMSTHMSVHMSIHLSIHMSGHVGTHVYAHVYAHVLVLCTCPTHMSVHMSTHMSPDMSTYMFYIQIRGAARVVESEEPRLCRAVEIRPHRDDYRRHRSFKNRSSNQRQDTAIGPWRFAGCGDRRRKADGRQASLGVSSEDPPASPASARLVEGQAAFASEQRKIPLTRKRKGRPPRGTAREKSREAPSRDLWPV